ncbi:MAG: hypothetical protein M1820_001300 [Bogoriella megaspora]|nr:MAG: hypothetical protein M1820_001300 [Bogoriella megaspora]
MQATTFCSALVFALVAAAFHYEDLEPRAPAITAAPACQLNCVQQCQQLNIPGISWSQKQFDATILAAVEVVYVNPEAGTTSTSTVYNPGLTTSVVDGTTRTSYGSYTVLQIPNRSGVSPQTATYASSNYYGGADGIGTIAFGTAVSFLPNEIAWSGSVPTTENGAATCAVHGAFNTERLPNPAVVTSIQSVRSGNGYAGLDEDPHGVMWAPIFNTATVDGCGQAFLSNFYLDVAAFGCATEAALPALLRRQASSSITGPISGTATVLTSTSTVTGTVTPQLTVAPQQVSRNGTVPTPPSTGSPTVLTPETTSTSSTTSPASGSASTSSTSSRIIVTFSPPRTIPTTQSILTVSSPSSSVISTFTSPSSSSIASSSSAIVSSPSSSSVIVASSSSSSITTPPSPSSTSSLTPTSTSGGTAGPASTAATPTLVPPTSISSSQSASTTISTDTTSTSTFTTLINQASQTLVVVAGGSGTTLTTLNTLQPSGVTGNASVPITSGPGIIGVTTTIASPNGTFTAVVGTTARNGSLTTSTLQPFLGNNAPQQFGEGLKLVGVQAALMGAAQLVMGWL